MRGDFHTVDDTVQNDGVMNRYTLRIPQGELNVVGTERLEVWVAGSTSPLYAKNMTAMGWSVQENARDKLRP